MNYFLEEHCSPFYDIKIRQNCNGSVVKYLTNVIEGLLVQASLEALCCVIEQNAVSSAGNTLTCLKKC